MATLPTTTRARALRWGAASLLAAALMIAPARPAQALNRDVRTVLFAGAYGMIGGTVLGLVTFPATQEVKTIFVGTSIGLYLGIAIGVYYVFDRENASQALRRHASLEPPRSEDPGRVGRELRLVASVRQVSELEAYSLGVARPARVEVPVLRF